MVDEEEEVREWLGCLSLAPKVLEAGLVGSSETRREEKKREGESQRCFGIELELEENLKEQ